MSILAAQFNYDGFKAACHMINTGIVPFAFFMAVVGFLQAWTSGSGDLEHKKMSFVTFIVIIGLLALWYPPQGQPSIVQGLWELFTGPNSISENIGAPTVADTDAKLAALIVLETGASVAKDKQENPGESGRQWSEYLQQIVGLGGIFFLQFAKILQNMSLMIAGALGSFFFGLMMFQQTRGTAITFMLVTVSVAMWPLGWALARFGTNFLLNLALESEGGSFLAGAVLNNDPFGAMTAISWSAVVSAWIVVTTTGMPFFLQQLVSYGAASFGGQFLGSAQGTALGGLMEGRAPVAGIGGGTGGGRAALPAPSATVSGPAGLPEALRLTR
jgi:hypothetical protein